VIAEHPVTIVCGETGSGKTTQIPKICLAMGRGRTRRIGHTQPRRIAARAVAERIAEELGTPLGKDVGYKVRFTDKTTSSAAIKVMTDGILLAEIQNDPRLWQYDTIILDEAHERSLNIDFLIGYLERLLPKRRDLRLVITSATIHPESFAAHFGGAPIVEVSGRTYPVEIRWRPIHEDDADEEGAQEHAIAEALEELIREGPGDVLVFLSSEREIRETAEVLARRFAASIEILPLFGRLAASDQHRVFHPGNKRRVVLATNIAETSLTVPGIHFVIDTGFARISRFNPRTKVQRLPIEPVSQASADQRAGRCGRLGPGICIRLYSEEDYQQRERFTPPEILRTNLASVILQMKVMGLGDLETFPFLDPPDARAAREGVRLLQDLRALDDQGSPTEIGRQLARFPVDPRIGRIVLAGRDEGCLPEALVAAAALSVVDPRERPADNPAAADEAQARFDDSRSDFLSYLTLWDELQEKLDQPTRGPLRRWSREHFLSYTRLREWTEVHRQLVEICREIPALRRAAESPRRRVGAAPQAAARDAPRGARTPAAVGPGANATETASAGAASVPTAGAPQNGAPAAPAGAAAPRTARADRIDGPDYAPLHRALLTGLIANVGLRDEERSSYQGASGKTFFVFPGSALFKKPPKWILAAELVETTRLYGRTCARIDPRWIEDVGAHLVKRSYSDPWWDEASGRVLAKERVTLAGLTIEAGRPVDFGRIDRTVAHEVFLRGALVEGTIRTRGRFLEHNRALVEEITGLEDRARRRDIFAGDEALYAFYALRVPAEVYDTATFEVWRRKAEAARPDLLQASRGDLVREGAGDLDPASFPDIWRTGDVELPLTYRFEPGDAADGVTVEVPLAALANLRPEPFEWIVPGYLPEKVEALLRALPKSQRKRFLPLAATADAFLDRREATRPSLRIALRDFLERRGGTRLDTEEPLFDEDRLPHHLRMNFRVVGDDGATVAEGRSLVAIQERLGKRARQELHTLAGGSRWERAGITTWDFGELPETVELAAGAGRIAAYPALADRGGSVDLVLAPSPEAARLTTAIGASRLVLLALPEQAKVAAKAVSKALVMRAGTLPPNPFPTLSAAPIGPTAAARDVADEVVVAATRALLVDAIKGKNASAGGPRSAAELAAVADAIRGRIWQEASEVGKLTESSLEKAAAIEPRLATMSSVALRTDVERQLRHLFFRGFVLFTPRRWLSRFPHYLRGIELRLDKAAHDADRDARRLAELAPFWDRFLESVGRRDPAEVESDSWIDYRFALEEFRLSLFAQEVKTAMPVSAKRLEAMWRELVGA
jgi:ATP-dependent helicase HrpA